MTASASLPPSLVGVEELAGAPRVLVVERREPGVSISVTVSSVDAGQRTSSHAHVALA